MKHKEISVGDSVLWFTDDDTIRKSSTNRGVVEDISGNIMFITIYGVSRGYRILMSAKKINGTWYAYRSYTGYLEKVFKTRKEPWMSSFMVWYKDYDVSK